MIGLRQILDRSRMVRAGLVLVAALLGVMAPRGAGAQTADQPTTRIVSLVPGLTEILFTLDAAPMVAGVSDYCIYPPEAAQKPRVGGLINPSLENVLAQSPTVVLLYRSQEDFAAKLARLNVRTEMFSTDTLADILSAIDRLGGETGHTTQAAQLSARLQRELAPAPAWPEGVTSPTGVIIVSRDDAAPTSLYQAAEGNFLGELFVRAGGQLAIPRGAPIDREAIIRANPDIIIDLNSPAGAGERQPGAGGGVTQLPRNVQRETGLWKSLATVDAVKRGHVYFWHDRYTAVPGPGVAQSARVLRAIIADSRAAAGQ